MNRFGLFLLLPASLVLFFGGGIDAADCNFSGLTDADETASGASLDCNDNLIPDECEAAPLALRTRTLLGVGLSSHSVTSADFNGDGLADIAAGNVDGVTLALRDATGPESGPETQFSTSRTLLEGRTKAWCVGDFNGDGSSDLAALQPSRFVILYGDGAGTFAVPEGTPLANGLQALAVGQFSNDSASDLVVANRVGDNVTVALHTGENGVQPSLREYAVGEYPAAVVVADLDGDGALDVVTANRDSSDLSILRGDGDGAFAVAERLPLNRERPEHLAAGDFNGDGRADLAVGYRDGIDVLLQSQTGALESRQLRVSFAPDQLLTSDLAGDGHSDLIAVVSNPQGTVVFRGTDSGTFDISALNLGRRPAAAGAFDLDGDGDKELTLTVVGNETATLLWNDERAERNFIPFHPPERLIVDGFPHSESSGDLDGDGDIDIVTGNNRMNSPVGYSVFMNNGDGTFTGPTHVESHLASFNLRLVDIDADSDLDMAVVDPRFSIAGLLLNDGQGAFALGPTYDVGSGAFHITSGDLDDDGYPELVTSNPTVSTVTVLRNQRDGTFVREQELRVGSIPRASVVVDFDHDGDLDIATAGIGSGEVTLLEQASPGVFRPPVSVFVTERPNFIVANDFDQDGRVDLATGSESGRSIAVLWNNGGGQWDETNAPANGLPIYSLVTDDISGDGRPDVIGMSVNGGTVALLITRPDRTFGAPIEIQVESEPRFGSSGDLDGNGSIDLAIANRLTGTVSVVRNALDVAPFAADALTDVCTAADFFRISLPLQSSGSALRATKYIVPVRDDPNLLPTHFQNINRWRLHEEFLGGVFPEMFPTLPDDRDFFDTLVGRRATRDYYIGAILRTETPNGIVYAFSVVADTGFDVQELLLLEEVQAVYDTLQQSFDLRPLVYQPEGDLARRRAEEWTNPPFDILFESGDPGIDYEPYTIAVGYGRVRLLTLAEFEEASDSGRLTFQDVIVVDEAPRDIEGVVGGVITGAIQGSLSHVAVRTARRGTPNAFVRDAREAFTPWAGQLVRLQVLADQYFVDAATIEEAQEFWSSSRPSLPTTPTLDVAYGGLDQFHEMDLLATETFTPVARFGGKATNLARLQRQLTGPFVQYQEAGFAIPVRYYLEFMEANTLTVDGREVTYRDYIEELIANDDFQSDSEQRFVALDQFRDRARSEGIVDPDLVAQLIARISEVFGGTRTMVRFRSSSNLEDTLEFSGAGLYESTSVCAEDTIDPSSPDSSHCDSQRTNERTIERALKKVWTSLWTFRAHEERTFFQVPADSIAMGILVNRAFLDEAVNGVAFTGSPRNTADKRYVITAQVGEASVVSPEPGTTVERNLLEIESGQVARIIRERSSSLVAPGETVMTDDQLRELGALMAHVDANLPLDLEGHDREEVLLDFEFKIESDGSLAVKQVRPFLVPSTVPQSPTFELAIEEGTSACAVFSGERLGRGPRVEYELKSVAQFKPGILELPTGSDSFSGELFDEVRFGPEQLLADPLDDGLFRVRRLGATGSDVTYRFDFEQSFVLPNGDSLKLEIFDVNFKSRGGVPLQRQRALDEEYLTSELSMIGSLNDVPVASYSSCRYELLPLFAMDIGLDDGSVIHLEERFLEAESLTETGPASLTRARVELEGEVRTETDYWRLAYSARRHNVEVKYWVVLEPMLVLPSLEKPVRVIEIGVPDREFEGGPPPVVKEASVLYLDESFDVIGTPSVTSFERGEIDPRGDVAFRRGDANADAQLDVADPLSILGFLFRRGTEPSCVKAADANDDGKITVTDAVTILLRLFAGGSPLPQPAENCDFDVTADTLTCQAFLPCDA